MGKTLKYGEFTFSKPNTRPTTGSYRSTKGISKDTYDKPHTMKDGGACYAKGGPKKPAQKPLKREPEAMVRKEVALLKKAGAPKAIIEHERAEMKAPAEMKKGGMSKMDMKMGKVMREYGDRELRSGSKEGPVVTNPKQALAIAYSEGRKAVKKQIGGAITEAERAQMAQSAQNTEKERADSRVLQQLARKYGAQEEAAERRGLMESARAMGARPMTDRERMMMQGTGAAMTEGERARMMGRKNYAIGGSVESKLKKHASMPASQAHGPGAAAKLAKGGVPTFSKVPKIARMK